MLHLEELQQQQAIKLTFWLLHWDLLQHIYLAFSIPLSSSLSQPFICLLPSSSPLQPSQPVWPSSLLWSNSTARHRRSSRYNLEQEAPQPPPAPLLLLFQLVEDRVHPRSLQHNILILYRHPIVVPATQILSLLVPY